MDLWAHTPGKGEPERWQPLDEHLRNVAELAERFASGFGAGSLARYLGLLHDLGKASECFQRYLRICYDAEKTGSAAPRTRVDHKCAGAIRATSLGPAGQMLALAIIGHHGGIPNTATAKSRLREPESPESEHAAHLICALLGDLACSPTALPDWCRNAVQCEALIRMLFSALVDADFLDTERHWFPERWGLRDGSASLHDLWRTFQANQAQLVSGAPDTRVNAIRNELYAACVNAADAPQGVFRLTVPTGGGKTRSGMGFALRHAVKHGLNRVIVAIPYTSIIDQNAAEYRNILGDANVLEHHSALESTDTEEYSEEAMRRTLATENWDAPVVVTTTVQLFESLFSNKPSRCRKLHSIASSVLILDEVQTLPTGLTTPILDMLKELVNHYGVSLVLSTATQPAFVGESPYLSGFVAAVDIVPDPAPFFAELKRVDYRIEQEPWAWERVADHMRSREQVLCVVNSRKDALELFRTLEDPAALHLSTLMCPAHRRDALGEIRQRLRDGDVCRVVSTQVVEAGVDLDFPCVMRAYGPLDRIVQAAGRCNREGLLPRRGEVVVFRPADGRDPRGSYATAMAESKRVLDEPGCDLHCPDLFERYFRMLWQDCELDEHGVQDRRSALDFPEVASRFRMIADDTVSVVVRYGDPGPAPVLENVSRKGAASRDDWRKLQPFAASLYRNDVERKLQSLREVVDGLYVWEGTYDSRTGLSDDLPDPSDLIV